MSENKEINPTEFAEWFRNLPEEEKRKGSLIEAQRAEEDWREFSACLERGVCSICYKPTKSFSVKNPCLHWLLKPKGFKKKHFKDIYAQFNYFRISAYVRWVAATEALGRNINDLKVEHSGKNIIDFTAKYKHLKWSFSCSESDFKGHPTAKMGNTPHYHMQMYVQNKPFIKYNDFHIPFHNEDLCNFELILNHSDMIKPSYGRGDGMEALLGSEERLEAIIDHSIPLREEQEAAFHMSTIVMAPEGETISGDLLAEAFKEAEATGRTRTAVLKEKLKDANIRTLVSPGEGVPEPMQRGGRKKANHTIKADEN
ncbi:hypothetical protein [Desulfuromonas acetoxidans]|uniref:hypothetical protein n=1 Tax=Desulfuromonas acetoxidans TaxID=891 RepID=UPI00292E67C1|nr:hypothetical protein [Desulfuromonas acetoxidans]